MLRLSKSNLEKKKNYEKRLTQLSSQIEALINDYNETINSVNDFVVDIQSLQQDYYDGRSENWQESDRGTDYENWKDEWESFDTLEEIECPEMDFDEFINLSDSMD